MAVAVAVGAELPLAPPHAPTLQAEQQGSLYVVPQAVAITRSTLHAEQQVQRGAVLQLVLRQAAAILQPHAGIEEALLGRGGAWGGVGGVLVCVYVCCVCLEGWFWVGLRVI